MPQKRMSRKEYEAELRLLQEELARLQRWVRETGARIIILFEGRDAAGKGGVIKAITERVSPRVFRVVALPAPTDREKTQMYLQRYVTELPSAGEVILFDRSWYNRAGVEKVMGFCTPEEYRAFLHNCPRYEKSLVEDGILLFKFWLTVSEKEQQKRMEARIRDPRKHWKLSPMDLESRRRWYEYSRARDAMLDATDTQYAPWHVLRTNDKRCGRLNCIRHLLDRIPYESPPPFEVDLPPRDLELEYDDVVALEHRRFVEEVYGVSSE